MSLWESPEALQRWHAGAESRERNLAAVSDALIALAGVRPGMRVLDCGCGSGELAAVLSAGVEPGGRVVGVDSSAGMLAAARAAHGERANLEFRLADLAHLELDGDLFDAAVARCVVMLIPDEVSALRRIRSCLRPGARFACSVWARQSERCAIHAQVLGELGEEPRPPATLAMVVRLGDEQLLAGSLAAAGFGDVATLRVRCDARYPRLETAVADLMSSPAWLEALRGLDPDARESAQRLLGERAEVFGTGEGAVLPGEQLVGVGTA